MNRSKTGPKIALVNDTRPGGHVGCILVMRRLCHGLGEAGCEVTAQLPLLKLSWATMADAVAGCDLLVVNGEGTLHHDGRGALLIAKAVEQAVAAGRPVALINSVWQENKIAANVASSLSLVYTRESRSAAALAALRVPATVVPDLLLSAPAVVGLADFAPTPGSMAVFDHVNPRTAIFLARFAMRHKAQFHSMAPRPSLRSFRTFVRYCRFMVRAGFPAPLRDDHLGQALAAEIVITGRFHGACLAIAAGRPFVAIMSNTHKIEGMLEDAQLGEGAIVLKCLADARQLTETIERAAGALREVARDIRRLGAFREACTRYLARAKGDSDQMFVALVKLAEEGRSRC